MSDEMNEAIFGARRRGTHLAAAGDEPQHAVPADEPVPDFNGGARTSVPVGEEPSMNQLLRAHRLARGMSGDRSTPPTPAELDSALDHYRKD